MADNNYGSNNNQRERKSINTKGYNQTNGKAIHPSALEVSYMDDMVRLAFSPELPEAQRTETRRYDYQNQWITCITRAKAFDLYHKILEKVVPAIEEKKSKSVSVPIAGVNQLSVSSGYREADDKCHPYIALIKNIGNDLKSTEIIMYEFAEGEVVEDYDPIKGTFGERIFTACEFDLFVQALTDFVSASGKAYVHASRCVDKAYKDTLTSGLNKIGEKLGVDLTFHSTYRKDGMGYGSIFDKQGSGTPAEQQNVNSIDELEAALG